MLMFGYNKERLLMRMIDSIAFHGAEWLAMAHSLIDDLSQPYKDIIQHMTDTNAIDSHANQALVASNLKAKSRITPNTWLGDSGDRLMSFDQFRPWHV
jgi:hypothetical protein